MMAVSQSARDTAERIASQATHVELSTDPGFQDEFLQSLNFTWRCRRDAVAVRRRGPFPKPCAALVRRTAVP
jgi:uncharacterized 2Fe-2S/4Fe-4S cluster protein (DUF4445 family)